MVWVDPPPPLRAALAFKDQHAELEQSWIRSHKMQKQNMELSKKNLALKKTLRERRDAASSGIVVCRNVCCCVFCVLVSSSCCKCV